MHFGGRRPSSSLKDAEDFGSSQCPIPSRDPSDYSVPREHLLSTNSRGCTPDTPLTASEVISGYSPAPSQLLNMGSHSHHQKPAQQGLDELNMFPLKGAAKGRSLKTRICHAWMKINHPQMDPNFSHLPRGLNKRIDPNKDPLRDKLRRLRRRKKKTTRPVVLDDLPQQCPEPIHWPEPSIERESPRVAPPVRPQMIFKNAGPAFDDYENPLGGEHSVLYEGEEGREERNCATQLALRERSVSDRFLARHGQKHLTNSLIGRAPPISRRYIQKEVQRRKFTANKIAEETRAPGSQAATELPGSPVPLGLPMNGARGFQWDHALLPSKSVPDFRVALTMESSGSSQVPRDDKTAEDNSRSHTLDQRDSSISDSAVGISEWMDKVENTAGLRNVGFSGSESSLCYTRRGNIACHTDSPSCSSSIYGEESDSSDGHYVDGTRDTIYSSKHLAKIYLQEIETLGGSVHSDLTGSSLHSLPGTFSSAFPPTLSDKIHSATTIKDSQNSDQRHAVNEIVIYKTPGTGIAPQMTVPTLESERRERDKPTPSLLASGEPAKGVQGRRNPLKAPLSIHTLQANARYYLKDTSQQTSRVSLGPSVGSTVSENSRPMINESQTEMDHLFARGKGSLQGGRTLSVVPRPGNTVQTDLLRNPNMLRTAVTPGAMNYHLPRASPRLNHQSPQVQSALDGLYTAHSPHPGQQLHQYAQHRPQSPMSQAENLHSQRPREHLRDSSPTMEHEMHWAKRHIENDVTIVQDGPYPKIPGRKMPSIEELMYSTRRRETTTRSGSSQGTCPDHDTYHTPNVNEARQFAARALELPHRPRPVDSMCAGSEISLTGNGQAAAETRHPNGVSTYHKRTQ